MKRGRFFNTRFRVVVCPIAWLIRSSQDDDSFVEDELFTCDRLISIFIDECGFPFQVFVNIWGFSRVVLVVQMLWRLWSALKDSNRFRNTKYQMNTN